NPVVSSILDEERGVRGIHLDRVAGRETSKINRYVTGGDLELQEVGLLVLEPNLCFGPRAEERTRPDLQLQICRRPRVQRILGRERGVDLCRRPVFRPGAPE